jgi:hypothetical protein
MELRFIKTKNNLTLSYDYQYSNAPKKSENSVKEKFIEFEKKLY